jgi:hypothetical protein
MTSKDFESLRDHILTLNPYFTLGFANAYKDTLTDAIYSREKGNTKVVFPEDRLGNYFYLRNDPNSSFVSTQGTQDCAFGKASYDDRLTVYLVAIVSNADEFELINNLRNSCLRFGNMNVIPTNAMWQRENVMLTEMQGFDESEIAKALTNLKNDTTIVRIQLQITKQFIPSKCINNPCKDCN